MSDYHDLMTELAAIVSRRTTDLATAERAYHDGMAAAAAELRRAEADARETDRRAASAAAAVVEVDREAERLWSDLHRTRAWPGKRPRAAPEPAPATAQPRLDLDDDASTALLTEAARRIHGGPPRAGVPASGKPPALMPPLLPFVGAATTAAAATLAGALMALAALDLPGAGFTRLLGWLVYFASPFAGVPVAASWLRRRWSARLLLGGLGALTGLIITLT
jgi:hypothetical protein